MKRTMDVLNPDQRTLLELLDEVGPTLPVQRRIQVYRGLADFVEIKRHRVRLLKTVKILEDAERRCQKLHCEKQACYRNGFDAN